MLRSCRALVKFDKFSNTLVRLHLSELVQAGGLEISKG